MVMGSQILDTQELTRSVAPGNVEMVYPNRRFAPMTQTASIKAGNRTQSQEKRLRVRARLQSCRKKPARSAFLAAAGPPAELEERSRKKTSPAFACERHQYSPRRDFRNDSSMRRPTATAPVHSFPGCPNPRTSGKSVTRQESQNICSIGPLRLADSGDRNPSAEIVAKGRTTA